MGLASDDSVCVHVEDASRDLEPPSWSSTSCARLADPTLEDRPLTKTTVIGRERWLFMALVPDGIETVELSTDQAREVLTVADNVVAVERSATPRTLSWTTSTGQRETIEVWSDY